MYGNLQKIIKTFTGGEVAPRKVPRVGAGAGSGYVTQQETRQENKNWEIHADFNNRMEARKSKKQLWKPSSEAFPLAFNNGF